MEKDAPKIYNNFIRHDGHLVSGMTTSLVKKNSIN